MPLSLHVFPLHRRRAQGASQGNEGEDCARNVSVSFYKRVLLGTQHHVLT